MVTTFFIKLQIQTFVELLQKKNYLTLPLEIKISIIKYENIGKKRKQIFDFMEIINTLTIGGFHLTLDFKKAVYFTK